MAKAARERPIETRNNLTRREAEARADLLADLHYDVSLDLDTGDQTFASDTTVTFDCRRPGTGTFIEFIGPAVSKIELNGKALSTRAFAGGRIQLEDLAARNVLRVSGTARYMRDGSGVHWFQDPVDGHVYLHSQFASNDAHRAFACFDQPDLKATYALRVKAPSDWVVVANTPGAADERGSWTFPTTKPMSTYLVAVVAGHYHSVHQDHRGIPLGIYCRQSLAQYLDPDEIFEITRNGFDFFEEKFDQPYAFGKYDQLFVPEFSYGAMENTGCVTFLESYVFRSRVTDAVRMRRAETILHEMAHMWFGDLVTMRWWDDLWLNESFATYMGVLATSEATRFRKAWTGFALGFKAGAKAQDQLPTTHPIVADIPDVESVVLNFDAITYEKGASVLKQLVAWVGDEAFFRGVQIYLKRHEYRCAELADFLAALEQSSGRDLTSWSKLWLQQAGVNTMSVESVLGGAQIKSSTLVQEAPPEHPTLRPHRLRVGLFDVEGTALKRRRSVELDVEGALTPLPQLAGERVPDLLLVNDDDLTYAKVRLDGRSLKTLRTHLRGLDDDLARALAWGDLWDMVRDAQLRARAYVAMALANIDVETDASTVAVLQGEIVRAIETYGDVGNRAAVRESLARAASERLPRMQPASDLQLLWTSAFINAARSPDDLRWVRGLLDGSTTLEGLNADFAVRWNVVNALATTGAAGEELISAELKGDPTDQGRRAAASARAARPLSEAKAEAWMTLTARGDVSLAMRRAVADGFHRADQEALLSEFVQPYFESLLPIWNAHPIEEALDMVEATYPRTVVTQEVVDLGDKWLARDLPGPIRRSLLEAQDGTKRALRARAFDGSRLPHEGDHLLPKA